MQKLTNGTKNFWLQISSLLLFGIILTVFAAKIIDYWILLIIGIIITFIQTSYLLDEIKEKLLRVLPDEFIYNVADLAAYSSLDFAWFESQTEDLKSLGFLHLIDYTTGNSVGFARCFSHPEYYCYAEINQVFKPNGELFSQNLSIISFFDENWTLATMNQPAKSSNSISYGFWRNPQNVSVFFPNISLNDFFNEHQQWRNDMIRDLGLTIITDVSWEKYVEFQREGTIYRKETLNKKNLLWAMIEVTLFELNPKNQWLGNYQKYKNNY